ncbi:MAG TPA: DUF1934 domain-containing protein [Halanaerobiales bacterium]|nr:DUF1934 domain-containing protein [Halanaerobiales bacterium]
MKKVKIKVNNKQKFPDGQKDEISYQGKGEYKYKNGKHYLIYNETNRGLEDVKTIVRLNEKNNRILLKRAQPKEMRQVFDVKEKCNFLYNLGNHKMRFTTDTKKLHIETSPQRGEININYDLLQHGEVFTSNQLNIKYSFIDKE